MNITTDNGASLSRLHKLAAFADYLLNTRLDEYIEKSLQFSYELDIPVLRFFSALSSQQRYDITRKSTIEFLTNLANNLGTSLIEDGLQQWKANQMPVVDRDAIQAEDITLINYMRKKTMLFFVPGFATSTDEILDLIQEIDFFTLQSITAATNVYIDLFRQRLQDHSHFIQKVAETIPGAVYVFDVQAYKGVYSNNKLADIIGYDQKDLNQLGPKVITSLVHPEDQDILKEQLEAVKLAKDDENIVAKYRIKKSDGGYKWLANYESIFKRTDSNEVWQTIGITLDVDKEQKATDALHQREQQLVEAQEIAMLGNYYWDFENKATFVSPKAAELLQMDVSDFEHFLQKIHPADREKVQIETEKALVTGNYNCEYRIVGSKGVKVIWARGVVDYEHGKAVGMTGTVMDITEHTALLQQLARADKRHKQAEALAHIGTYSITLSTNEVEWSDEMYRIHEVDRDQKLSYDFVLGTVHDDDRKMTDKKFTESASLQKAYDFYYRIVTKSGATKILHSRGNVEMDESTGAMRLVGTDQDVTEKQTLIRSLIKSESLYKQAEEIAAMGNWSWDPMLNKLTWTDELYRIYGLAPQSEKITMKRFLSFVHPEDLEYVQKGVEKLDSQDSLDYTFRIITEGGTQKWLRSIAQVLRNKDGEISFVIGTEQDVTEKQTLIERLQESEKLYKQAQSMAQMGNWTWDLQTKQITWSDELFRIYELTQKTPLTQEEWEGYLDPVEKDRLTTTFRECVESKKLLDIVHKVILPNGTTKLVHRKGEIIFDAAGQAVKMVGTTQDVTEQFKIQSELRESQIFIRKITDATPSIIASYNVNTGQYVYISEGLHKLLGYDTTEVMQKGIAFFIEILHPDDLAPLVEKNKKALEEASASLDKTDVVMEFTYRMKHRNGEYRWFHTYGTIFDRNAEGRVEHILNISLDVTDQKEAIETIKEQEYFIQQIADASPTILYMFDVPSQSIAYINREAFFVLGYLPDEMIDEGDNITSLLYHPDDINLLPQRRQSNKTFQQVDSMIQYECRMKHKDGEYRWLLIREIVFKTSKDGKITQIIGAALDITRRKEMEKTILQNTLQLEQSNASLEEFAYVASHDLKEPLRKISTFGDRLVASQLDKMSDEGKIYLHKIVDASQRMQNMISDLLSISMISGNRQFEMTSLQKILEDTLQTLEVKIEQQGAVVRYQSLPEANVIPPQFRQLFQNLISNSLKFVREDVQPLIQISCQAALAEEVDRYGVTKAKDHIKLVFADNGIGFENEYAQKIFAIFQRLHGRTEYEGSGIGLAICKKIVEHHGGVIFAHGRPGAGATFTIILPA